METDAREAEEKEKPQIRKGLKRSRKDQARLGKKHTSGAKARRILGGLAARLKPCPSQNLLS